MYCNLLLHVPLANMVWEQTFVLGGIKGTPKTYHSWVANLNFPSFAWLKIMTSSFKVHKGLKTNISLLSLKLLLSFLFPSLSLSLFFFLLSLVKEQLSLSKPLFNKDCVFSWLATPMPTSSLCHVVLSFGTYFHYEGPLYGAIAYTPCYGAKASILILNILSSCL